MPSSILSSPAGAASPSATFTDPGTPKNDPRIISLVVVLGVAAVILLAVIVMLTIRVKRRKDRASMGGPYHGFSMERDHPAAHITPFGNHGAHSGSNAPQFQHAPGSDMRIAHRRPDGAWHFADSRTPFTPAGVSDLDVVPSPSSSSFFPFSSQINIAKEHEARAARKARKGYDAEYDFPVEPITPPPPAYKRHSRDDNGFP